MSTSRPDRRTVLVTGARGKVGRALLPQLAAAGYSVRAVSSAPVAAPGSVRWLQRDLATASEAQLRDDLVGCDAVVHLAVEQRDISRMEAVNVVATERLARAAAAVGVTAVCFTSSIAVYGSTTRKRANESAPLIDGERDRPEQYWVHDSLRAYARSKVRAETALRAASAGLRIVVLRPSVIVDAEDLRAAAAVGAAQRAASWRQSTHHVPLHDVTASILWGLRRALGAGTAPGVEVFNVTDAHDGGTYADLFASAGVTRGSLHGIPLPPVPLLVLRLAKWWRRGRSWPMRRPMGGSSFPADRLRRAGFEPPTGMARARSDAFSTAVDGDRAEASSRSVAATATDQRIPSSSRSI